MTVDSPTAVVVSGTAGAIGGATAEAFLRLGFCVVGIDCAAIADSSGVGAPGRLLVESPSYHHCVADVRDPCALAGAVAEYRRLGRLAHVVSIAGGAVSGEPAAIDPVAEDVEMFRASVDLNLVSQFILARACLPWLRESTAASGGRSITLTSSINGLLGMDMYGYSAAKAGIAGLARTLAARLGSEGIRVNAVAPGTVRTPRTERIWAHDGDHFQRLAATTSLGRLTTAEDVAEMVTALATRLTSVTGQVLTVDSGQSSTWHY